MKQGIQWRCYPMCLFVLLYIAGLLPGIHHKLAQYLPFVFLAGIVVYTLPAYMPGVLPQRPLRTLTIGLFFISLGIFNVHITNDRELPEHYTSIAECDQALGRIRQTGLTGGGNHKLIIHLEKGCLGDSCFAMAGSILAYMIDSLAAPKISQKIAFVWDPVEIKGPSNPGAFDLKVFYAKKGISHQLFLYPADYVAISEPENLSIPGKATEIRDVALAVLKEYVGDPNKRALISSLALGYREELDPSTEKEFARAGIIHVLAVSGLHVGIVCSVLYLILGLPNRGSIVKRSVSFGGYVIITGCYALLTGMSPSVVRATLMVWCFLFAFLLKRRNHPLNSMASCAFLILLIDPSMLYSVGFQFSFLAVTGILMFFKSFNRSIQCRHKLTQYLWASFTLSVAAQIWLIPLLAGYFHQFSLISPVSSIVAIPLTYGIVLCGLGCLILHWILPGVAWLLSSVAAFLAGLLEKSSFFFSSIPFACLEGLFLSTPEILVAYITLISLMIYLFFPGKKSFLRAAICFFVLIILKINYRIALREKEEFVLFSHREGIQISCYSNGHMVSIADTSVKKSAFGSDTYQGMLGPSSIRSLHFGLDSINSGTLIYNHPLLQFSDKIFMFYNGNTPHALKETVLTPLDFLVIHGEEQFSINALENLPANCLVLHDELSWKMRKSINEFAETKGIQIYDMREKGALILNKKQEMSR